jgi:hypothetical protein
LRSALLCLVFEQFYNSRFLSVINEQQCQWRRHIRTEWVCRKWL